MTIHSDIPDSDVDPESPGTATLFTRLRDNPLAIAEGDPTAPPILGLDPIGEVVVSSPVAQVDFQDGVGGIVFDGTYDSYTLEFISVVPDTDNVDFRARVFVGGVLQTGSVYESFGVVSPQITIGVNIGSDVGEGLDGEIKSFTPVSITQYKRFIYNVVYTGFTATTSGFRGIAQYTTSANAIDGLRFYFSSGNIESGIFRLYGTRK